MTTINMSRGHFRLEMMELSGIYISIRKKRKYISELIGRTWKPGTSLNWCTNS